VAEKEKKKTDLSGAFTKVRVDNRFFWFQFVFPKLTSPMSLSAPFDVGGTISGMFGFAAMSWLLSRKGT